MDKIVYLNCPLCGKEYYIARVLYLEQQRNQKMKLMCPYCKEEFSGKDAEFSESSPNQTGEIIL